MMMLLQLKQIVPCPPLPRILMRNDLLLERFTLLVLKATHFLLPTKQSDEIKLEGRRDENSPA